MSISKLEKILTILNRSIDNTKKVCFSIQQQLESHHSKLNYLTQALKSYESNLVNRTEAFSAEHYKQIRLFSDNIIHAIQLQKNLTDQLSHKLQDEQNKLKTQLIKKDKINELISANAHQVIKSIDLKDQQYNLDLYNAKHFKK